MIKPENSVKQDQA